MPGLEALEDEDSLAAPPVAADESASSLLGFPAGDPMLQALYAGSVGPSDDLPVPGTGLAPEAVISTEQGEEAEMGAPVKGKSSAGRPVINLMANAAFQLQPKQSTGYYDSSESNSPTAAVPVSFMAGTYAAAPQTHAAHGSADVEYIVLSEEGPSTDPTQDAQTSDPGVASSQGFPPSAQPAAASAAFGAPIAAADRFGQAFSSGPQMPAIPAVQPAPQPFNFGLPPVQAEQQAGVFGQQAAAMPSYGSFGGFGVKASATVDGHPASGSRPAQRRVHAKPTRRGGK